MVATDNPGGEPLQEPVAAQGQGGHIQQQLYRPELAKPVYLDKPLQQPVAVEDQEGQIPQQEQNYIPELSQPVYPKI